MNQPITYPFLFDDEANAEKALHEKLIDAMTPGLEIAFCPDEAMKAGAFIEDALSEEEAYESRFDGEDESFLQSIQQKEGVSHD